MAHTIFQFTNTFSLFAWLFLLILPNWKYTLKILASGWVVLLALLYAFLLSQGIGDFSFESFGSIASIRALFQDDMALTAGWIHYLAFDMLVGCLIVHQSKEQGIPRWLYSICLPFTFMFGPVGYLMYKLLSLRYKGAAWFTPRF
ncbi:MAG: ABA4-like family protein [Saprospiraceae bacterium]|nr:ABA4-like family protein [Saprospiraceae bacterium]MDZ4705848.1 ABA4-like family protein [Saprospiraceae bacterium]